jgi:glutathione S-transferase
MITLYHAPKSRSSRMIWLLEELNAPYRIRPVSIFRAMEGSGSPDPTNPHPDKQVPAIEHNGVVITESIAIALYLADAFPAAGIGPAIGSPQRGPYLSWLAWYAAALEPAIFAQFAGELDSRPEKRRNYDAAARRLQTTLSRGPYILGDRFSAADVVIGSAIGWARQALPDSDVLDAYAMRCKARPAALLAVGKDEVEGIQRAA